jgi:hypothetical protein
MLSPKRCSAGAVDEEAAALHLRQHRAQRQLDVRIERAHAERVELCGELLRQAVHGRGRGGRLAPVRGVVRRRLQQGELPVRGGLARQGVKPQ